MSDFYKNHSNLIENLTIADRPLTELIEEIQQTYLSDKRPWIIGFSGGKDSTTILSLIYFAIKKLSIKKRIKHIYVVTSDTLVETPVVVDLIKSTMTTIESQAIKDKLPISCHTVYPKNDQTFWVNLLGKGYPAPQQTFRWCTERMKINPVSDFIENTVAKYGEVILALGARSDESNSRAQVIERHKIGGSVLSKHTSLNNAYTYMPISKWSADDVWEYLLMGPTPWNSSNYDLFYLYKGSNQGECPLVIDKSTPSCGNSRFGCWTCTVVNKDRAMEGLVDSGESWMEPLLEFRNMLSESTKPEKKAKYRNYKRRSGYVTYMRGEINDDTSSDKKNVPGPYWMKVRQEWLYKLLKIEFKINKTEKNIQLITIDELEAIRKEWIRDPNEPDWEDTLPKIYKNVYPDKYIDWIKNDIGIFSENDIKLLNKLAKKYGLANEMIKKLIETEIKVTGLGRRTGIFKALESTLKKNWDDLESVNKQNYLEKNKFDLWNNEISQIKKQKEIFNLVNK